MSEISGFELIQGRSNQVRFDTECPGCKTLTEEIAWVEHNSFLEQIQCATCGYEKTTEIKLVGDELHGINANLEIRRRLFEDAQDEIRSVCMKCGYCSLIPNENMQLPASCPKCGSKEMDVSWCLGNKAMLIWLGKHVLGQSDD
jgi:predicted Zn-ribbon and HTH transcriptional regulator